MSYIFEKDSLKRFQEMAHIDHFKMTVTVPNGTFQTVLPPSMLRNAGQMLSIIKKNEALDYRLYASVAQNSVFDKAMIRSDTFWLNVPYRKEVMRSIFHKPYSDKQKELVVCQENRRMFFMGLALTAIVPSATFAVYLRSQIPSSRLYKITHAELVAVLPEGTLTGDCEQDFDRAFNHLWFCFPQDITGYDAGLKRFSLEEMG